MNHFLDFCLYQVEFPDVTINVFTMNAIANSVFSQVDEEGRSHGVLLEIIEHW